MIIKEFQKSTASIAPNKKIPPPPGFHDFVENMSTYSTGYQSHIRRAILMLDFQTEDLKLRVEEEIIKTGLGAGKTSAVIFRPIAVGTLTKPDMNTINRTLQAHTYKRDSNATAFSRKSWYRTSNPEEEKTLNELFADWKNGN